MVKNYRELYLLVLSARGRKVGFTFRKIDGSSRVVRPTDRIILKDGCLRFFCAERNAWRAACLGSVTSVTDQYGWPVSDEEIGRVLFYDRPLVWTISETISSANVD